MSEVSLDDLFKEAVKEMRKAAVAATKPARKAEATPPANRRYDWPENYNRGQNIGLLHKETGTLLGVFSEWIHKTEPDVRKLVREESELPLHAVEEVSGDWGKHTPSRVPYTPSASLVYHHAELTVSLAQDSLTAHVQLEVSCQGIAILEARLQSPCTFGGPDSILCLPPGTNIFPALSRESKLAIREFICPSNS